jgi:hypothetical protein
MQRWPSSQVVMQGRQRHELQRHELSCRNTANLVFITLASTNVASYKRNYSTTPRATKGTIAQRHELQKEL